MFEALAVPAINRLLRANIGALDKLKAHAGKTALLASPPFELRLTVSEDGQVLAAGREAVPDVSIDVSPGVLLRVLARDESAWSAAHVTGDVEFAAAIDHLRRNLVWDYEEDLSHVLGDIGAHRVAHAMRELDRWGRNAGRNLGHAFAEYLSYEQPVLATARAVEQFVSDVDELRDETARVEKRIELIERRLSMRKP